MAGCIGRRAQSKIFARAAVPPLDIPYLCPLRCCEAWAHLFSSEPCLELTFLHPRLAPVPSRVPCDVVPRASCRSVPCLGQRCLPHVRVCACVLRVVLRSGAQSRQAQVYYFRKYNIWPGGPRFRHPSPKIRSADTGLTPRYYPVLTAHRISGLNSAGSRVASATAMHRRCDDKGRDLFLFTRNVS